MSRPVTCRAPGKLLIAGEYAVLTPGQPAIVAAIDRYITVTAGPAWHADAELVTDLTTTPLLLHRNRAGRLPHPAATHHPKELTHLLWALATLDELREHLGAPPLPVRLETRSALHEHGVKIGLGSSGAVTVAATHALSAFHRLPLTPELRLRLALLATAGADPRASGADIAASTWGGWIRYTAPDRDELRHSTAAHGILATLRAPWPGLSLHPLPPPTSPLHVGWTGTPAFTTHKTGQLQDSTWWDSHAHDRFRTRSARVVDALSDALLHGSHTPLLNGIEAARRLLTDLDQQTAAGIFTPALTSLTAAAHLLEGAGKPSGAGGGDCGIALLPAQAPPQSLHRLWNDNGITPLTLNTAPHPTAPGRTPCSVGPALASPLPTHAGASSRRSP